MSFLCDTNKVEQWDCWAYPTPPLHSLSHAWFTDCIVRYSRASHPLKCRWEQVGTNKPGTPMQDNSRRTTAHKRVGVDLKHTHKRKPLQTPLWCASNSSLTRWGSRVAWNRQGKFTDTWCTGELFSLRNDRCCWQKGEGEISGGNIEMKQS